MIILSRAYYETALICLNGHVINATADRHPARNQNFCSECGQSTISKCQKCETNIRGRYINPGVLSASKYFPPSYCHHCGSSYPWTEEKLKAAIELASLSDDITSDEKDELEKSINDLISEGPRTTVAATKFKRILSKLGSELASGIKDILIDVASETAKRILWP